MKTITYLFWKVGMLDLSCPHIQVIIVKEVWKVGWKRSFSKAPSSCGILHANLRIPTALSFPDKGTVEICGIKEQS